MDFAFLYFSIIRKAGSRFRHPRPNSKPGVGLMTGVEAPVMGPDEIATIKFDYSYFYQIHSAETGGELSRKNSKRLTIHNTDRIFSAISITCGAAIVIEKNGKKIWNEITPFRLILRVLARDTAGLNKYIAMQLSIV